MHTFEERQQINSLTKNIFGCVVLPFTGKHIGRYTLDGLVFVIQYENRPLNGSLAVSANPSVGWSWITIG